MKLLDFVRQFGLSHGVPYLGRYTKLDQTKTIPGKSQADTFHLPSFATNDEAQTFHAINLRGLLDAHTLRGLHVRCKVRMLRSEFVIVPVASTMKWRSVSSSGFLMNDQGNRRFLPNTESS
jgi:hypothetical protein